MSDDHGAAVRYGPDAPSEAELRLLGRLDGKRVLELGCGDGTIPVALAKQGTKVIAVEASVEQIGDARRRCEREEVTVELHQGDLADLAFVRADTIDVALSVGSLDPETDLDRVFRQVHRVLRPEAPFVVSIPHPVSLLGEGRRWWDGQAVTTADLFASLTRANFRVDTLLEPEPVGRSSRSPSTLILRGRKVGT